MTVLSKGFRVSGSGFTSNELGFGVHI